MQTFVALMRGINVGSTRSLPMAELRALCIKAGLKHPETYIQSGNKGRRRKSGSSPLAERFGSTTA